MINGPVDTVVVVACGAGGVAGSTGILVME